MVRRSGVIVTFQTRLSCCRRSPMRRTATRDSWTRRSPVLRRSPRAWIMEGSVWGRGRMWGHTRKLQP